MRHQRRCSHQCKFLKIPKNQFEKIEVVNQLNESLVYATVKNYTAEYDKIWIYDKIHHEINQYCSKHSLHEVFIEKFDEIDEELVLALKEDINLWAPGIQIISVRVTKPKIPGKIEEMFIRIEATRAQISSVRQQNNILKEKGETEVQKTIKDAEQQLAMKRIELEKMLREKENELVRSKAKNDMEYSKKFSKLKTKFEIEKAEIQGIISSQNEESLELVFFYFWLTPFR